METYVIVFKRQQFQYLMKAVALAACALALSFIIAALCYYYIGDAVKGLWFANSLKLAMFFVPFGIAVLYQKPFAKNIPYGVFFGLIVLTTSLALFWIVVQTSVWLLACSLVGAMFLFSYSVCKGLKLKKTNYKGLDIKKSKDLSVLTGMTMLIVFFAILLEVVLSLFTSKPPTTYPTLIIVALIYARFNAVDIFLMREQMSAGCVLNQKEINQVVVKTALNLYLNFIGMIFVIDFIKILTKIAVEIPIKKSVSK